MPRKKRTKIERALISVSDKTGIVEFARALKQRGVEITSTGGTAQVLREADIEVMDVSEVTGFPEMMDGRVKTLHPRVHGALLALRDNAAHALAMITHDIAGIDLLVVNLYPFSATVSKKRVTIKEAVEQIDIGGPAMLRSGSKNHDYVTVVCDPKDYGKVIAEMDANKGSTYLGTRWNLGTKAYRHTSDYDAAIVNWRERRIKVTRSVLLKRW